MVAPKRGIDIFGNRDWKSIVTSLDWNRILIEARGRHLKHAGSDDVCGHCVVAVLMTEY